MRFTLCVALLIGPALNPLRAVAAVPVEINVDATMPGGSLKSVWHFYGYDEPNYTAVPDSVALIKTVVAANAEPVYLRQHFLLNSGDGKPYLKWGSTNVYTEDAAGNPVYSWKILDEIFDAMTGNGARPLFQLGMMPEALTSGPQPYRNSETYKLDGGALYPPKDYDNWAGLIRAIAEHVRDRYPGAEQTWLWELWNEPNIDYWQGTFEEYCKLFDVTEHALRSVLPGATFGGPHTASADRFFRDFLRHCAEGTNNVTGETGTRLDYIAFHAKGGVRLVDGHVQMNLGNQLRLHQRGFQAVAEAPIYRNTPIVIGEADPDGCAGCPSSQFPQHDYRNSPAYGAYEVAMMKYSLDLARATGVNLEGLLTWAWMFDQKPIFAGFRTLSTHGIDKPVLNAFKMLGRMQGRELPLESSAGLGWQTVLNDGVRGAADINGMAALDGETVRVLIWSYHDDLVPAEPTPVRLRIRLPEGIPAERLLTHWRVDDANSNAFTAWTNLGGPQAPDTAQMHAMRNAMELQALGAPATVTAVDGVAAIAFDLPRHGLSLVELGPLSIRLP
jgi:xylan 1,4-beta-xylosidase